MWIIHVSVSQVSTLTGFTVLIAVCFQTLYSTNYRAQNNGLSQVIFWPTLVYDQTSFNLVYRTNIIVYIFNGQLLTIYNDVTIFNIKLLTNFKYLFWVQNYEILVLVSILIYLLQVDMAWQLKIAFNLHGWPHNLYTNHDEVNVTHIFIRKWVMMSHSLWDGMACSS